MRNLLSRNRQADHDVLGPGLDSGRAIGIVPQGVPSKPLESTKPHTSLAQLTPPISSHWDRNCHLQHCTKWSALRSLRARCSRAASARRRPKVRTDRAAQFLLILVRGTTLVVLASWCLARRFGLYGVYAVKGRVATAVLVLAVAAGRERAEGYAGLPFVEARLAKGVCHHALLAVGALVLLVPLKSDELVLLPLARGDDDGAAVVGAEVPASGRSGD